MPFESLSERLQMALRRITGRGRLTEKDIEDMMKEVRLFSCWKPTSITKS